MGGEAVGSGRKICELADGAGLSRPYAIVMAVVSLLGAQANMTGRRLTRTPRRIRVATSGSRGGPSGQAEVDRQAVGE